MDSGKNPSINALNQTPPESVDSSCSRHDYNSVEYCMSHKRGVALVISNKFEDMKQPLKDRLGADVDHETMVKLFHKMGFERIFEYKDCGFNDMKTHLQHAANEVDSQQMDCFAVAILSFGNEAIINCKSIQGQASQIAIEELLQLIKGKNCPSLAGKPKLVFLQTCPMETKRETAEGEHDQKEARKLPVEADVLIVHSLIAGSGYWNAEKPSMFVETLNETMEKYWNDKSKRLDFLTLLTRMSKAVARKIDEFQISAKIPHVSSTLTKELFFDYQSV